MKITQRTKKVEVSLSRQALLHKKSITQANYDIGQMFVNENRHILNTGKRTGRLYGNHRASAPGEVPSSRGGRLAKSVDYKVHGWQKMSLGQTAPYADYLETGTKRIRPRRNVIVAINNIAAQAVNAYYKMSKRYIR
jgi:hypothetical protein